MIITCIRAFAHDTPSASLLVPLRRVRITERILLRAFGTTPKSRLTLDFRYARNVILQKELRDRIFPSFFPFK